ncbi:TonB-dependent receptor domain-containing protein [Croceicoccus estronivorus]|uniref:TonB-dependent receptor domain-containing protein n=1 Tax=Croceicoccus estronivorus TaxID=1172626 RepID=UPI000A50B6EF|nr:TonB-dependent receptor [Croceicoccus estronivorus]
MRSITLSLLALVPATPALAQSVQLDDEAANPEEIVVIAGRYPGSVDAPQPPVAELEEADIAAYGVSSLSELLDALSPQVSSGRGRGGGHPVILVNGQRVSSFREMRNYPPEAVRKVEILPEEVALRYGYPADQRVVNFILKPNFSSKTVAGEYNGPTRGGYLDTELEGSILKIDGPRRLNISVKATDTSMLTEAERKVRQSDSNIPTVAGDPDPAGYRSLVADSRDITAEATWSTGLGEEGADGQLSINGTYTRDDSRSLAGLNMVTLTAPDGSSERRSLAGALTRTTQSDTFEAGVTLNKPLGAWQLTATVDGSHGETTTQIDRRADTSGLVADAAAGLLAIDGPLPALPDAGRDEARVTNDSLSNKLTLVGSPLRLPAGEASFTLSAGFDYTGIDSRDSRVNGRTNLNRNDFNTGLNIGLPIASRREGVLDAIGDLSLNFTAGINELSDFGTLTNWNAGLTWSPTESLSLQASYIAEDAAPSLTDLGNPQVQSFNVSVYDFTRGETALVTVTTGGNPDLSKEKRRDIKLSANWQLPFLSRSSLVAEYFHNRSDDVTAAFPVLTPTIEAAFPDRVVRDATGQLVAIDRRPVTYERMESSHLRYGINLSGEFGKAAPESDAGQGGRGSGRGPGGRGAGGGDRAGSGGHDASAMRMPGRRQDGKGRWNLAVYHTVRFDETVTIASGGPVLDLLDGDALSDGGVARHAIEMEGGGFYRGFGMRLRGSYTAPVHVNGSGLPGSSDLRFGSTFVLNLRVFADLGQQQRLVAASPFFKGLRVSFQLDNIFDSRQRVTDANGTVPLSYQADYRDPTGRYVGIDIRKMF